MRTSRIGRVARKLGPFLVGATVAMFAINIVIARQDLPEYGTWTGIRPLEEKLHKLQRFAADGPVDAVVLGSSVADFGISARVLSEQMTAATGSPYRAFNFSSGGSELATMPKLYRLMRTVAKPRTLLVVLPAGTKRSNEIVPQSPDYILAHAPVQRGLAHPWLLPLEKRFWDIPMIRYGSALRDRALYGGFENLPGQGADLYEINEFGDTVSFSYQTSSADLQTLRKLFEELLIPLTPAQTAVPDSRENLAHYFNELDIDAMTELRELAAADDCELVVVAHNVAATYFPEPIADAAYLRARRQYFALVAEELDAKLVFKIQDYSAPRAALTDTVHLNRYGAEDFTRLVAGGLVELAGGRQLEPLPAPPRYPELPDIPSADVTVTAFSALIRGPTTDRDRTLRLRILRNHAIPDIPPGPLSVMVRLPDGRELVAPARFTSDEIVEAVFRDAPTSPGDLFLVRLVTESGSRATALNQPLGDYAWIGE